MKRRLSSILTLPYKLSVLFLASFGIYWFIFQFQKTNVGGAIIYFAAVGLAYFLVGTYKRVQINGDTLYISNYLREIQLPLTEIETVEGPSWKTRTPEIVITLHSPSAFGPTIKFAPKFFSGREIAEELRLHTYNV